MSRTVVYAEQGLDYKYERIFEGLEIEYTPVSIYAFLRRMTRRLDTETSYYYHIRYLRWRGYLLTLPMYLLALTVCFLRGITVVWSCHNVVEHNIPSPRYNRLLRAIIERAADEVIVFDRAMVSRLGPGKEKVRVANFGAFDSFFKSSTEKNQAFTDRYRGWLAERGVDAPEVVFLGVYTPHKKIEWLVDYLESSEQADGLVIAPGYPESVDCSNCLLVHEEKVVAEIHDVFSAGRPIGYVAHDNISVPTAIYVYATYGIPMVAYRSAPIASIIERAGMGVVFDAPDGLPEAVAHVRANYETYRRKAHRFIKTHTWGRAQRVHREVFESLRDAASKGK